VNKGRKTEVLPPARSAPNQTSVEDDWGGNSRQTAHRAATGHCAITTNQAGRPILKLKSINLFLSSKIAGTIQNNSKEIKSATNRITGPNR
jgi:hypothetical protein